MSPTSSPEVSAGVPCSIAETTTGFEPWMRNPNSPDSRWTTTVLSHSTKETGSRRVSQLKLLVVLVRRLQKAEKGIINARCESH
jgi:hypothetical protein